MLDTIPAGYIVASNGIIYATGETSAEAYANFRDDMRDAGMIAQPGAFKVYPATAALIANEEAGEQDEWTVRDGIADLA